MRKHLEADEVDVLAAADSSLWKDTFSLMLARASHFGSMKVVRWLVEVKGELPTTYCIQRAFERADFAMLFFLIASASSAASATSAIADLKWLFLVINSNSVRPTADYEAIDVAAWEKAFDVTLPEPKLGAEMLARLVVSLIVKFKYKLSHGNILTLARKLTPQSVYYILEQAEVTSDEMSIETAARFYNTELDISRVDISALSPHFNAPMTSELAGSILSRYTSTGVTKNFLDHLKHRGQAFDETCPFLDTVRGLTEVILILEIPKDIWQVWMTRAIHARSLIHVQQFIGYRYTKDTRPEVERIMFLTCMRRFHAEIANTLLETFPTLKVPKWINWVEDILRRAPHGGRCEELRESLAEHPEISALFDFDVEIPPRVEAWHWWGISTDGGSTYSRSQCPDPEVDPRFAALKTLADIADNATWLNEEIRSATDCYFEVGASDEDDDSGEIFYRDSQDCILWAVEADTGRVYVHNPNNLFSRVFVAASIPKFLTAIDQENKAWFAKNHHGRGEDSK